MPVLKHYEKIASVEGGHSGGLTAVAFSPMGNYIATAGYDNKVCIWKIAADKLLHTMEGPCKTLSLAWLPYQEDTVLCGMEDGTVSALTFTHPYLRSRLKAVAFPAHNSPVECLAVPQSRYSFASGAHGELFVWKKAAEDKWTPDINLGEPPQTSHTAGRPVVVTSIHWARTTMYGSILLATYLYHGVVVYKNDKWERLHAIHIHGCIADAGISPDRTKLVVSNLATGFDIYAMDTWASIGSLRNPAGDTMRAIPVLVAHDGNAIVGGSTIGDVHIWDADTHCVHQILALGRNVKVLALSAFYDKARDQFLIATGISNRDAEVSMVLWRAIGSRRETRWSPHALRSEIAALVHWRIFTSFLVGGLLLGLASIAWGSLYA